MDYPILIESIVYAIYQILFYLINKYLIKFKKFNKITFNQLIKALLYLFFEVIFIFCALNQNIFQLI